VAVKIRLKRLGKIHAPYYRIVVADSRKKRDGRVIEEIGKYHPTENPSLIEVTSERAQYWLSVGAQPTPQVLAILKLTGDWGTFKGEKDAKNTVQTREPKPEFNPDTKKKPVLKPKAKAEPAKAEASAEEATPEVAPEEAVPADAAPAEEAPAAPAEETPAEETPAEEASTEAPSEEAPAEEAPAEEPAATEGDDAKAKAEKAE
jgi:small subunit ribosomal protein S16